MYATVDIKNGEEIDYSAYPTDWAALDCEGDVSG